MSDSSSNLKSPESVLVLLMCHAYSVVKIDVIADFLKKDGEAAVAQQLWYQG